MKKLTLITCGLILLVATFAYGWGLMQAGGGVESEGAVTYEVWLDLEETAADSYVAVNDGTGADWTYFDYPSVHTSGEFKEGSASQLFNTASDAVYSPAAWTDEHFEVSFWWRTSNNNDLMVQFELGNSNNVCQEGEFIIRRDFDTDHHDLKLEAYENGVGISTNISTSPSFDLSVSGTWYCLAFDIDVSDWTITAKYSTDVTTCEYTASGTWNDITFAGWSAAPTNIATLSQTVYLGTINANEAEAYFDGFRMRSK